MKVCFLVMAHHQPKVFHSLLDCLTVANCEVSVHIDRRSEFRQFVRSGNRVHFMRDRQKVHWAGWSQTRAILGLMRFALRATDGDYFVLLGGTDFPIKHPSLFVEHLESCWPSNFINHYPVVPGIWGYNLCSRFHLVDLKAAVFDGKFDIQREPTPLRAPMLKGVKWLESALNRRYAPRPVSQLRPFHGSTRWCLNREAVQWVVDHFRSRQSLPLRRHLRFTTSSDELFIQTAILNSKLNRTCRGFDEVESDEIFSGIRKPLDDEKKVSFHYIDWSRENPAILDERDLPILIGSDKYFAVKFLDDRSLGLIEKLAQEVF